MSINRAAAIRAWTTLCGSPGNVSSTLAISVSAIASESPSEQRRTGSPDHTLNLVLSTDAVRVPRERVSAFLVVRPEWGLWPRFSRALPRPSGLR